MAKKTLATIMSLSAVFVVSELGAHAVLTMRCKVRARELNYLITKNDTEFEFRDHDLSRKIAIVPCNRAVIDAFFNELSARAKQYVEPPESMRNDQTIQVDIDGRNISVSPGSDLGRFLVKTPSLGMNLFIQARRTCSETNLKKEH